MRVFLLAIGLLVMPSPTTPQDLARALLTAEGSAMPQSNGRGAAARAARERPAYPVMRGAPRLRHKRRMGISAASKAIGPAKRACTLIVDDIVAAWRSHA